MTNEVRETPWLTFTYTNYRGETAERRVRADSIRIGWGSNQWHPEPQWIMTAWDLDKSRFRDFAVKDIVFASAPPPAVPDAVGVRETPVDAAEIGHAFDRWWSKNGSPGRRSYSKKAWFAALSSIEPTPSHELRHFANCVQCGRIVDTREKSAGGDAYGCEVGADRWVCSFECYETELGDTLSPEPQAAGCMCRDVPIGSHKVSVLMELPEHMASSRVARVRDGLSPYITVDSCLVEEIRDLWSKGITTTGCCCGHNRAQGFIGVASQDIHAMKAMGYLVAPNASRPSDEDSFVPKSIRSEAQASNAGAVEYVKPTPELIHHMRYGSDHTRIAVGQEPEMGETPWPRFGECLASEVYKIAEAHVRAALSTPEPQTGERDGEVVGFVSKTSLERLRTGNSPRETVYGKEAVNEAVPLVRQSDFLAERAKTATAYAEADHWKRNYKAAERDGNTWRDVEFAEAEAGGVTKRRLAEVEERAREDEQKIADLTERLKRLNTIATNRAYMMQAYRNMLGPKGAEVAEMWDRQGVERFHASWEPGANALSGEEIAETIMQWERAPKRRVIDIDTGELAPEDEDRAALRAKPEAQAIGGKEGDQ